MVDSDDLDRSVSGGISDIGCVAVGYKVSVGGSGYSSLPGGRIGSLYSDG